MVLLRFGVWCIYLFVLPLITKFAYSTVIAEYDMIIAVVQDADVKCRSPSACIQLSVYELFSITSHHIILIYFPR